MTLFSRRSVAAAMAAAALLVSAPAARADFTNDQIKELLGELKLIRQALEKQAAGVPQGGGAPGAPIDDKVSMQVPTSGVIMGSDKAPLVMIEYTDYQCPFCQQFHNTAWDQIKKNYIDTGKVRFINRDFPLDFHENAKRAAIAAHCGEEQGKFWELRHVMHVNADKLQPDKLVGYAKDIGLDVAKFSSCVLGEKYKDQVEKSYAEGLSVGVSGTPSFVLGRIKDGKIEGVRIVGAQPYNAFDAKIRDMLN
ncbi:MAG TPA: thioredoxin domain-containing protein [Casimicrobiaceae bacterium]|nr:thioredoxin domain-containing protein [Casimicrobiaceae bacterium]